MARKKIIKKILPPINFKYNNFLVTLFINKILKCGKKNIAKKIVDNAFKYIFNKTNQNPLLIFEKAIRNISPRVILKMKRIGGATYQIPVLLNIFNASNLALRWLIDISNKKTGKPMYLKLGSEILDAAKGIGNTVKKKEETHKMAKANKAFLFNT